MKKNKIYARTWEGEYNRELKLLENSSISKANKDILKRWHIYLLSTGNKFRYQPEKGRQ